MVVYIHLYIPEAIYIHLYIPIYIHICIPIDIHLYIPIYIHLYIPIYIHLYIPIDIHLYIPIYIHFCPLSHSSTCLMHSYSLLPVAADSVPALPPGPQNVNGTRITDLITTAKVFTQTLVLFLNERHQSFDSVSCPHTKQHTTDPAIRSPVWPHRGKPVDVLSSH